MSSLATACCLLLALVLALADSHFVNEFDKEAKLECPPNQIFSVIGSEHSNYYEDRRWHFQCRPAPGNTNGCYWTYYLNAFDHLLQFDCPGNEVLNGMNSYHENYYEDRRFMVQCCGVAGKSTSNCYKTGYVNAWDGVMNYFVPEGQAIKGVYSVHDNYYEDRRFEFTVCHLV